MSRKILYVTVGAALLAAVFLISGYTHPKKLRFQQHLEISQGVEDTSLSIDADSFSSHLPVVNIETNGQTIPGKPELNQRVSEIENTYISASMQIMDQKEELNTLKTEAAIDSKVQIRVRGNSSRRFDKVGYLFKFTDKDGIEQEEPVLGMEKNSTWVLHGPFLDKTLMRNYMWYNLSGQIMEWAPDVRYCELFLNGTYQGVYVMTEQISVAPGRINATKYDGRAPVSSYVLCADRASINDVEYLDNFSWYARRSSSRMEIKYPGSKKLTPELTEEISRDFSEFEKTLYSFDYDSKRFGYQNFIDVQNFVDYFIINEITQNTDAGIYSTYFYKDVAGKIKMCVWDFNNCCDNFMEEQQPMAGFYMQGRPWFFMLCRDEEFVELIISRYRELRKGILSDDAVKAYIQDVQNYLGPAIDRNFEVWGYSFDADEDLMDEEFRKIGSYEAAVEQYQGRLISRMGWMDKHIEALRSYSHESRNKKFNH